MNLYQDPYASRGRLEASIAPRMDPVVYCADQHSELISPEQIQQYEDQGFLVLENVFSGEEINCFQRELERLRQDEIIKRSKETVTEPDNDPGNLAVRSVFKVHELSLVFKKLASDRRLAGVAQHILQDRIYVHQSRLNFKPGFRGKEFYWHSDFETWHVEDGMPRMRAMSVSIPLSPNYEYNGPLMLVPGSHKKYLVCAGDTPENHYRQSLKKQQYGVPSDEQLRYLLNHGEIFTFTGDPGSIVLFDCNTMHGSNGNITPFPRSNVFFVYNALSNKVESPYCARPPRPEHIASRENIYPIAPAERDAADYRRAS